MTTETHGAGASRPASDMSWYIGVLLAAPAWWLIYGQLIPVLGVGDVLVAGRSPQPYGRSTRFLYL